jgi:hypothetical protein
MNIHLPAILGFTRYQGFDTLPYNSFINKPDRNKPHMNPLRRSFMARWFQNPSENSKQLATIPVLVAFAQKIPGVFG